MDTIAAISTGMGNAGIGIVRISGSEAFEIAGSLYRTPSGRKVDIESYKGYTAHYGHVLTVAGEIIDECIMLIMKEPKSYTGENTVEFQCHGGSYAISRILEEVVKAGARPAEPGEFSKRAFLNGRMDLAQAEAVMDIIDSGSEYARKSAIDQLKGHESSMIKDLRAQILYHTAFIESALDDPEHYSVDGYGETLWNDVDNLVDTVNNLLKSVDNGRIIKEGINTVIVGKPNVGKSTLLNSLSGSECAIVTNIPGTTRDALEETVRLGDLQLNLTDTAGIRETDDVVEKIGVRISREKLEKADLVLGLLDAGSEMDEDDTEILHLMEGHKGIILINKTDIPGAQESVKKLKDKIEDLSGSERQVLEISARDRSGLEELEKLIRKMFIKGNIDYNNEVVITNIRHKDLLRQARESLMKVKESISMGLPEDFYSIDLMDAYDSLGLITGETAGEDLVNEIFSKFCTGK